MQNKKTRNLLTVILSLLCAVALAIGVSFTLPKNQKSANAAAVSVTPTITYGSLLYFGNTDYSASVSEADMSTTPLSYVSYTVNGNAITTTIEARSGYSDYRQNTIVAAKVTMSVTVPAQTVYTINYTVDHNLTGYYGRQHGLMDGWSTDPNDGFYFDNSSPGHNFGNSQRTNTVNGTSDKGTTGPHPNGHFVSLYNNTNSSDTLSVYTYYVFHVGEGGPANHTYTSYVNFSNFTVTAANIDGPSANGDITANYDKADKTFNFTYDTPDVEDYDGSNITYSTAYKNIKTTVQSAEYPDGSTIASTTYGFDGTVDVNGMPASKDGRFKATEAGTYTIKFDLTDEAMANGIAWTTASPKKLTFTINPAKVTVPAPTSTSAQYDPNGNSFSLDNNYDPTLMTPSGVTSGISWNTSTLKFDATNVNTYTVKYELKDKKNYMWNVGTGTTSDQTSTVDITRKAVSISSTPSTNIQYDLNSNNKITVTASTGTSETVSLHLYYCKSGDTTQLTNGVSDSLGELDVSQIATSGNYTLFVELANENVYTVNKNYEITGGPWSVPFKINADGVNSSSVKWQFTADGGAGTDLFLSDNVTQATIEYSYNKITMQAVKWAVQADITAITYLTLDTFCTAPGYTLGYKTVKVVNGVESAPLSTVTDAGDYRTYVALISDSDHLFDVANAHNPADLQKGWAVIPWTVSPKEVDFDAAGWVFSYDGDENDPAARWTKYDPANGSKPVFNKNFDIYVKIDDSFITDLGLTAADVVINYAGSNFESSPNYNGGSGTPKTTMAQITLKNNVTNYTLKSNTVNFDWYLYNEAIEVAGWTTKPMTGSSSGGTAKAFEFPVLDLPAGFENYVEYTYTFTINGTTYTDVSEADMKAAIFEYADETHKVTVTATPHVKTQYASQYDLDLSNTSSTGTAVIGDSKIMVNLEFTGSHSVYGDGGDFGVSATYYNNNNQSTPAMDFWALGGADTEVTLTLPDGSTQKFTADDLSGVINYLVNKGDYKFEFNMTDAQLSKKYSFSPSAILTLTISPKAIELPTLSEVVFKNDFVSLENYLGGSWNDYKEIITLGGTYDGVKKVGTYNVTLTLTDSNYCWDYGTDLSPAKATVKYSLADGTVSWTGNDTVAACDWKINPYVLKASGWNMNGKEGAVYNIPAELTEGLDVVINYLYYTDKASNPLGDGEVLSTGTTYFVKAELLGLDSDNFIFEDSQKTTSDFATYKIPKSGAAAALGAIKDFMTRTWLGLPIWAWLLIALAVLILLIIIIAVACKRRKSKEEKAEAKARKEEEKARREEERRMQQERLEAERELARAKQEAELEKIRMQAQMAGAAGMATMAMAQPQQQQMPQAMPTPVQQQMPQQMPQPQVQYVQSNDNSVLAEIKAELAEIKARQNMGAGYQQAAAQPAAQSLSAYANDPVATAELIRLKAESEAHMRAELERARSEAERARMEAELAKVRAESRYAYPAQQFDGNAMGGDMQKIGALAVAIWQSMQNGGQQPAMKAPEVPQLTEESVSSSAMYPPDAVVTTTTTVDTTQKPLRRDGKSDRNDFVDVDGFYDSID